MNSSHLFIKDARMFEESRQKVERIFVTDVSLARFSVAILDGFHLMNLIGQ
jgi:hypothetical protein